MAGLLLTGSNGYLGSAVAARLDALGVAWQALSLRLEAIAQGSLDHSTVIHCAGALRHRPDDWQRSNADGMARLLAGLCRPARIVFASSRSVYAPAPPGELLKESSPLQPRDGYSASKLAAEILLRESRHAGISCRLSTLFGHAPRGECPSLPNQAMQSLRKGERVHLVAQDCEVDYLAVSDAATLLVEIALRTDLRESAINIAGPRRSLHRMIEDLATNCGSDTSSIAHDYPASVAMNCLDTSLLVATVPGFESGKDAAAFS